MHHNINETTDVSLNPLPWQACFACYLCGLYGIADPVVPGLACIVLLIWCLRKVARVFGVFCFVIGFWVGSVTDVPTVDSRWLGHALPVEGTVEEVSTYPGQRISMRVGNVHSADGLVLPGYLLWNWDNPFEVPEPGQQFAAQLKIQEVHGRENFGLPSSDQRWAREQVWTRTFTRGPYPVNWLHGKNESIRAKLMRIVRASAPEGTGGAVIRALLFGDRFYLEPIFVDQIRRAGLSHMLALSGLNLGLAATAGYVLSWFVGYIYPRAYLYVPRQKLGVLFAVPPVITYTWLGDFAPSLERAAIMLLVMGACLFLGRVRSLQDALVLAATVLVLREPMAAYDVSLQLSVLAVLGIALFMPHAQRLLKPLSTGWRRGLYVPAALMGVTLSANAMILPLQAYYFGEFSPHLYLNLIWPFVVDCFVLPLSFLGLGLSLCPVTVSLGAICFSCATWGVDLMAGCLQYLDSRHWLGMWPILRPLWVQNLGYFMALIGVSAALGRRLGTRGYIFGLVAFIFLCWPLWSSLFQQRQEQIEMTVLDTGMSQALFIRTGSGKTVLLDGGGSWSFDYDIGRAVVGPALAWNHRPKVDIVLLSHVDADHVRGLYYILRTYEVGWFGWNGLLDNSVDSDILLGILGNANWPIRELHAGEVITIEPGIELEILHPKQGDNAATDNENSLVARLVWQGRGLVLLPGDAEKGALKQLCDVGQKLDAEVLVLPHHGSKSSFVPEFLRKVHFSWSVAACGFHNRFGFPHIDVRNFCASHSHLLTTAENGAIRFLWKKDCPVEVSTVREQRISWGHFFTDFLRCARETFAVLGQALIIRGEQMSTIMPTDKNVRNAIAWIEEYRKEGKSLAQLLSEAGARFNLTPLEEQAVLKFYRPEDPRE